jgi:16S rRNA processing protein RimM
MGSDRKICVGMIAGAHGVRGLIRLRSFTEDPEAIGDYDPLTDEAGEKSFAVKLKSTAKDFFIAEVEGVTTKEGAEALRGVKLYAPRSSLPKASKGEYYEADLIGLAAQDAEGKSFGQVRGVFNYGAGPFLEIGLSKADSFMLPFTDACVPQVDVKAGHVVIDPPEGWAVQEKTPKATKAKP